MGERMGKGEAAKPMGRDISHSSIHGWLEPCAGHCVFCSVVGKDISLTNLRPTFRWSLLYLIETIGNIFPENYRFIGWDCPRSSRPNDNERIAQVKRVTFDRLDPLGF